MINNLYNVIGKYLLEKARTKIPEDNKSYLYLSQNIDKIASILNQEKEIDIDNTISINNIEVNIESNDNNIIEINRKENIPLTEILIDATEHEIMNDFKSIQDITSIISNHTQSALKSIIYELKAQIRQNTYENIDEINDGFTINSYKRNYINGNYHNIINSASEFMDYINIRHKTYYLLEGILISKEDNETLGDIIRKYVYEDIGFYNDKLIYNLVPDHLIQKNSYNKIFNIIENEISNTKIIHHILEDYEQTERIQRRSQYAKNYIKYNYKQIIHHIENPNINNTIQILEKYSYNKEIQQFISTNMDVIHSIIQAIGEESTITKINIFNTLLKSIINDKFIINIEQIKRSIS